MALEHDSESALARAIREIGSQTAFGKLIGKRQSVVHGWLRDARPIPAEYVLQVEAATGVSRHDLRPDIYPREDEPRAAAGEARPALAGGSPDALDGVQS